MEFGTQGRETSGNSEQNNAKNYEHTDISPKTTPVALPSCLLRELYLYTYCCRKSAG